MGEYVFSISVSAVLCTILCILAPKSGGVDKYISYLSAIIMTIVIVMPLGHIAVGNNDFEFPIPEYKSKENYDLNKIAAESLAASINNSIEENCKKAKVIKIIVDTDDVSSFRVGCVEIHAEGDFDVAEVTEYLSELYNCKVNIHKE